MTVAAPTRPVQIQTNQGPNTKKGKWTECVSHDQGLFVIDTCRKIEPVVLHRSVTGHTNYTPGQAPCPEVVANTEQTQWYFV